MLLSERIESSEVRQLVRDWPEDLCVEVRACRVCGHMIAAKASMPGPRREPAID
jgi:hypothetical protein